MNRSLVRRVLATIALGAAATAADAASLDFKFDAANSSIKVTKNSRACLPFGGCALSASLITPFSDLTVNEGSSATFDFANFNISSGFGGDTDATIEATLAFVAPAVGPVSSTGTAAYFHAGGFFTSGLTGGSLTWDPGATQVTTSDGSKFTVTFNNLLGLQFGSTVKDSINIAVDKVAAADPGPGGVPEPASWAMITGGFGLLGGAMRRRKRTAVSVV